MAKVYNPSRLEVIGTCVAATGTVVKVRKEEDGDFHINISVDPEFMSLLSEGNYKNNGGRLVVEVIPDDQDTVTIPKAGRRITVIGAYVNDTNHNWRELHPAWLIRQAGAVGIDFGPGD